MLWNFVNFHRIQEPTTSINKMASSYLLAEKNMLTVAQECTVYDVIFMKHLQNYYNFSWKPVTHDNSLIGTLNQRVKFETQDQIVKKYLGGICNYKNMT